jgi:hypothetical protein
MDSIVEGAAKVVRDVVEMVRKVPSFRKKTDEEILTTLLNKPEIEPLNNGGSARQVEVFARKAKKFSTKDVMEKFGIAKRSAGANIAILRLRGVVEPDEPKSKDGFSQWRIAS